MFKNKARHRKNGAFFHLILMTSFLPAFDIPIIFLTFSAMATYYAYDYYNKKSFITKKDLTYALPNEDANVNDEYIQQENDPHNTSEEKRAIPTEDMYAPSSPNNDGMHPTRDLEPNEIYSVFFGRKPGFEAMLKKFRIDESPFFHSAIVIQMKPEEKKYFIIGRQSPAITDAKTTETIINLIRHGISTTPCNEKYYKLFKDSAFQINPKNIIHFYGSEIISAINKADAKICKKQSCTMLMSNCYSFSIYVLCNMMAALKERLNRNVDVSPRDVSTLYEEISKAATDHFGIGTLNNNAVMDALKSAYADREYCMELIQSRHLQSVRQRRV